MSPEVIAMKSMTSQEIIAPYNPMLQGDAGWDSKLEHEHIWQVMVDLVRITELEI